MLTLRGIIKTSVANLLGGGLSFLLSVLVARLLTPGENGYYAQFVLIYNLVFIFLNFGLGNGLTYYSAKNQLNPKQALGFIAKLAVILLIVIGIMVLLVVHSEFFQLVLQRFDIPLPMFLAGLVCGLLFLLLNLVAALLLGQQKYDAFNLSTIFRSLFPIILIGLFCFWWKNELVFAGLTSLGMLLALGYVLWCARGISAAMESGGTSQPVIEAKALFGYSLLAYFSNLLHYSSMRGVAFSLSYYHSAEYVGYFSLSLILLESVLILPGAMGQILFPKSSGNEFNADSVNYLIRISVLVGLFASVATWLLGPWLVHAILGARYEAVGTTFALMAPSVLIMAIPRILSQVLSGRGKPQYPLYAATLSSMVCVLASFFLVPRYGIAAAAATINMISAVTALITVWGYARACHTTLRAALLPTRADVMSIWRFTANRFASRV